MRKIESSWRRPRLTKEELVEIGIKGEPNRANRKYDINIHPYQCFTLCSQYGSRIKELAEMFAVDYNTVKNWIEERKEFGEAYRNGKDAFNVGRIEKALVMRALGYEYEEITTREIVVRKKSGFGKDAITELVPAVEKTTAKRSIAPDVEAMKFFLKNRSPERWKETQAQISLSQEVDGTKATISGLSTEDILKLRETVQGVLENTTVKSIEN